MVENVKQRLVKAGFKELKVSQSQRKCSGSNSLYQKEKHSWEACKPGEKYFVTRNTTTIVAFAIGAKWRPGNPFAMIGAHTDSPCLRLKPVSKKQGDGFIEVGVETYGGGLWHTWFDRDLSVAGRVMVQAKEGGIRQQLIKINRPILRIPTLAIHLDRQEKFEFNKETQLFPIAGLVAAEVNRQEKSAQGQKSEDDDTADFHPLKTPSERHHPYLVEIIAKEAGVAPSSILDFELLLYDTQKSCIGGLNDELIFSPRLDNQEMSFCATEALIQSVSSPKALSNESAIRLISLFDHEEIGSRTAQGADSNVLPTILRRLSVLGSDDASATAYEQSLSRSFLISADMAHSVNPNYAAKYESDHKPEMNKGTVIKINANARYATNSPGIVLLQEVAREAKTPLQLFVVRNDSSCGSTIGPMLSAALGTRTLDLGNAQLSMHSIRETGGIYDVEYAIKLFEGFFEHYTRLEESIIVD